MLIKNQSSMRSLKGEFMYDLLIKGGRVIDPSCNIDEKLDIATKGDRIAIVARDIQPQHSKQVIDASDKLVTPGLIDLHCHVYDIYRNGVKPDIAGVQQGVTTVVDAGTAGEAIFYGFPKYIIPSSRTSVFCFINIRSAGLTVPRELEDWREIDLDTTADIIRSNQDIIKGIKIRIRGKTIASSNTRVLEMAKETAQRFGLPIMVHIGEKTKQLSQISMLTEEVLSLMQQGDILSHVFTSGWGGILRPDGSIMPELRDAMQRGVVLDVGHGTSNFSFEVARKVMAQGVLPTTLSTDLGANTISGPVYGLTVTMSKFLALGLDMKQIIEMTTINAARAISIENKKGSLMPGMDADISILELQTGTWQLQDSQQQMIEAKNLIVPCITIKSGEAIPAQMVAQPRRVN